MKSSINTVNKRQPVGLKYLFFAELWERFSFYGMRALLTLYMTEYLLYSDEMSFGVFAAYGSLVYATPLIGGMLSDKILGYRKAIILGGFLMAIGHFVLAIENEYAFYSAMAFIIIGNGFFKPNISSMVGSLYEEDDSRRESGFTLFYMGINIGGMLAPLICGWLGVTYGWHYGFGLAGIGMLVGLLVFYMGVRKDVFQDQGLVPFPESYKDRFFGLTKSNWIVVICLMFVPLIALLVKYNEYEHYLVSLISVGLIGILSVIYYKSPRLERGRLIVIVYFTMLATFFWAVFEQGGSTLTLFAKRCVNLTFLNASQTNSINSFFIIVLAVFFSWFWKFLSKANRNPSSPVKFGIGLILLGTGFLIFGASGRWANTDILTPMYLLVLGYFFYTLGEMFISPIGLSKMTELSPVKYVSFLMGVWFLSSFYGHYFAGKIAKLTTNSTSEPMVSKSWLEQLAQKVTGFDDIAIHNGGEGVAMLSNYVSVFSMLGIVVILIGFVALIISPWIKRLMGGLS